jgi:type IV pilus assembly protein PilB
MDLQRDTFQQGIQEDEQASKTQLGQLLLQNGLINEVQLLQGLHYHKTHGVRLGEALLKLEFITERALKTTLARQLQIKIMPIDYIDLIPPNLTGYIPKDFAWKHKVCTIRKTKEHLVIVMDDPTQEAVVGLIQHSTKMKVSVWTAPEAVILQVLHRVYGPPGPDL